MQGSLQANTLEKRGWDYKLGHVLSALGAGFMALTGVLKITHEASSVERLLNTLGYAESVLLPLGMLELAGVVLYYFPRTSILGAILLTGYLGGAVATELRVSGMLLLPAITGLLLWSGLVLREPRAMELLRGRPAQ